MRMLLLDARVGFIGIGSALVVHCIKASTLAASGVTGLVLIFAGIPLFMYETYISGIARGQAEALLYMMPNKLVDFDE